MVPVAAVPFSTLFTYQQTGTAVVPLEGVAVQSSWLPDLTVSEGTEGSLFTQTTALIVVAFSIVTVVVPVVVDCASEVAVTVATLLVGTEIGAMYTPLLSMVPNGPVPVPLTDHFTRVLLRFVTIALHCAVPPTVT